MNININTVYVNQPINITKSNTNKSIQKNAAPNLNFKAAIPKDVSKLLDENITRTINAGPLNLIQNLKFHALLNKTLPIIMEPENFLNKGRESKVYRISDNFVAKIKRGKDADNAIHMYNVTTAPDKRFSSLPFYFGEPVLKSGNVEILKNATPSSNYRYCGTQYRGERQPSKEDIELYNNEYLPLCASLPQESYDNLAMGLKQLNSIRKISGYKLMSFTPDIINPNNILIADGQFRVVDKLDKIQQKNPNTIYTILEPLIIRLSPETTANRSNELFPHRINIFKKSLIAGEKAELPLQSTTKYEFSDFVLNEVVHPNAIILMENIQKLRDAGVNKSKRIEYINNVFN